MKKEINQMSSLELKGLAFQELVKIETAQKNLTELNKLIKNKMEQENTQSTPEVIAPETADSIVEQIKEENTEAPEVVA